MIKITFTLDYDPADIKKNKLQDIYKMIQEDISEAFYNKESKEGIMDLIRQEKLKARHPANINKKYRVVV